MPPDPLPPTSLPLRFSLQAPLRSSSSPTACLSCLVPFRRHLSLEHAAKEGDALRGSQVEDVRGGAERAAIEVVRILDPEHREPFISLARVFLAIGISPLEGLLFFSLRRPSYDSTLAGIAPFIDIWVPLKTASDIVEKLGLEDELAGLLDWSSRLAYSVEDKEEGGMVHNWKVGSDRIDPAQYSTSAMLSTTFSRVHLLPQGSQVRTLLPSTETASPFSSSIPTSFPALYSHLVDWTISEYESTGSDSVDSPAPRTSSQIDSDLAPSLLFHSLLSLLSLIGEMPSGAVTGSAYSLAGLTIDRNDISSGTSEGWKKGRLGLVDALVRLVGREWRTQVTREVEDRRVSDHPAVVGPPEETDMTSRMARLEQAVEGLRAARTDHKTVDVSRYSHEASGVQDQMELLRTRVVALEQATAAAEIEAKLSPTPSLWEQFPERTKRDVVVFFSVLVLSFLWSVVRK